MGRVAVVATCVLNQWAMDLQGNMERILASVNQAKAAGARYRCGPELEITGYSCGDHYHEGDTLEAAWEVVAHLMQHPACVDVMIDVGLPVSHKNVVYNCKLVFLNRKILLIRPKMILANDASMGYREGRWFTPWRKIRQVEEHPLPSCISTVTGQRSVIFGDAVIATWDTCIGYEICEELWNPESPHVPMSLDGVEIICNGSGSTQMMENANEGYKRIQNATARTGGCYLLANQRGCDGSPSYFAGYCCIGMNGDLVGLAMNHSLAQVQVITAAVDLETIRCYRHLIRSRCEHAANSTSYPRVQADFSLCGEGGVVCLPSCEPMVPQLPTMEVEVVEGPACWLWDYLRRSGRKGLLLSLAGDVDSSATATIVYHMCHKVVEAVAAGDEQVLSEVRTVVEDSDYMPTDPPELCGRLLHTLYLPTYDSSPHAAHCASQLAMAIGSKHLTVALDGGVAAMMESFTAASGSWTSSQEHSGIKQEQETLNHLHSRLRMTMLYLFAQLRLRTLGRAGELLVLTSNNIDNILAGSWAKYGDTSADVNLIGCFTEKEIEKALLFWAKNKLDLPILNDIILSKVNKSSDRMLTCEELAVMRKLQTIEYCGPYSMFGRLMYLWRDTYSPQEVGDKVKAFFRWYNHQRLKMALTTHYYVIGNGPPDIDRPIFYSRTWSWQFTTIDRMVAEHGENEK